MDELLGTRAQPDRWSRSGSLCADVGTGRAVLSPRPFPRSGSLPPLCFGQFFLDEAEHFLQNRMASVATLRGCSGSPRNAVRLPFGNSVRLRRNPHFQLNCLNKAFDLIDVAHFALRKIVEKEIDRSNATVPGDDKIGSRVGWWFAGSARYPSNPSGIT